MRNLFKSRLSNFIKSAKSQRDNLDWLIHAGIVQYAYTGRTNHLSDLLNQSVSVKSLPSVTIKDFIKEHTDLKIKTDTKTGVMTFVRADKDSVKKATIPPFKWYEWKKAKHNNVKETDYSKRLTTDVKKLIEKGHKNDIMSALLAGGLSTKDLMNMIDGLDSLQLKAA